MAKGQKKSNREAKKPKKSAAEKLKADTTAGQQLLQSGNKGAPKKA
jgi:hypothetical protein